jgi:hypothetical protein
MEYFNIIGAIQTYCDARGIVFIWQYNEFYTNIEASQKYENGQKILVIDLRPTPVLSGFKIAGITYSGLFMLGLKFDPDGRQASLDEKAIQKYQRRLKELSQLSAEIMADFSCMNELAVTPGQMNYLINTFDSNIDFVVYQNATFEQ